MGIESLFAGVKWTCGICGGPVANMRENCDCWEPCRCGRLAVSMLGQIRAANLHASAGCGTPGCPNRAIQRGCMETWWRTRDEGRYCVLPIGHKGRHRYSPLRGP